MSLRAALTADLPLKLTSLALSLFLWLLAAGEEPVSALMTVDLTVQAPAGRTLLHPPGAVRALVVGPRRELLKLSATPVRLTRVLPDSVEGDEVRLDLASAQVASALLLAGLNAEAPVIVQLPAPVRDHTERLLALCGAPIQWAALSSRIEGPVAALQPPDGGRLSVPGDPSAACFLAVAAAIVPGSEVTLCGVGVNRGRTGFLDALAAMGRHMASSNGYRPRQSSDMYPTYGDEIDWLYGTQRIFSYTFEMFPRSGSSRKHVPDERIARETKRNRAAVLYLIWEALFG